MALDRLVIRSEQMHLLGLSAKREAREQIIDRCWMEYRDLCEELGDTEVQRLADAGIARAEEAGYTVHADIQSFVLMTVYFGEGFEEVFDWAASIWGSNLPRSRKLSALEAAATEERIREITSEDNA